jgi:hypothetical protein
MWKEFDIYARIGRTWLGLHTRKNCLELGVGRVPAPHNATSLDEKFAQGEDGEGKSF